MPAVTLVDFKHFADLPLEQTDQDAKITLFLGMAEADYLELQGKGWAIDANGDTAYPGAAKRTLCEMTQFLLTGQVPEGSTVNGYPSGMVSGIPRYVRVL